MDRRKHDVDVIERVLGGVREHLGDDPPPTHIVDIHKPGDGTVELTIGIADDSESSEHIEKYGRR